MFKYHKENIKSKLPCYLINPAKRDLGKVSKQKLEKKPQNNGKTTKHNSM